MMTEFPFLSKVNYPFKSSSNKKNTFHRVKPYVSFDEIQWFMYCVQKHTLSGKLKKRD